MTYEGTFTTQRVQHAALETHGGLAWVDADGILNVRSSTQVPFLTRRALADIFDLPPDKVRVFCERVGGGFGGKQEMFVEDILALAALKTGRPVKLELTREEQFISTSTRHPMRVTVKAGADENGKLTALQLDVLSNTGAYGNHAGPVLFHSCGESISVYNCPNKKVDGIAAYTNTVPAGAFRGYGLPQTLFAVEAAIDELAKGLGISPYEMRRRNMVKSGDPMITPADTTHTDVHYGSYGLDQCLDLVERAMAAESAEARFVRRLADRRRHRAHHDRHRAAGRTHRRLQNLAARRRRLRPDRRHRGVRHPRHQHGASPDRRDRAGDHGRSHPPQAIRHRAWRARYRRLWQRRHFCGGTRHAGRGGKSRRELKHFAAAATGIDPDSCVLENDSAVCGKQRLSFAQLAEAARAQGKTLSASGTSTGTPRSVAFNVQGFRIAVNKGTGEIKILKSVHAADAGRVANPMQCRGQVEGGVAQSLGAALYEEMVIDDGGRVVNPKFRDYHLPSFADIPRTEVYFADTTDSIGPMGAKSMSESPYNPVAAALGNALADATGIRFTSVPFKPDRIWPALKEKFGVVTSPPFAERSIASSCDP